MADVTHDIVFRLPTGLVVFRLPNAICRASVWRSFAPVATAARNRAHIDDVFRAPYE